MKKNIDATLDLSKSLKDFEGQITKLLELNNISEWDGQVFKEREQKIRDAAIILAGQCIALFLYNLSQSQEAMDTAINQTKGWWYPETQKHGLRKRQILTVGNVLVTVIIPYLITRTKKDSKNKSSSQGFYPFLKWLGMEEGLTPLLWSTIASVWCNFWFI